MVLIPRIWRGLSLPGVGVGMFNGSMMYTIGTALERARENGHEVEVLVDGAWLIGMVVANDGTGVVLEGHEDEYAVVRLERVSAVRVLSSAPHRRKIRGGAPAGGVPRQPSFDDRAYDGAMPMPGPAAD